VVSFGAAAMSWLYEEVGYVRLLGLPCLLFWSPVTRCLIAIYWIRVRWLRTLSRSHRCDGASTAASAVDVQLGQYAAQTLVVPSKVDRASFIEHGRFIELGGALDRRIRANREYPVNPGGPW
jgi:hypothetical protein